MGAAEHGGIEVRLVGTAFDTTTDADGLWQIADVPAGDYDLELSRDGYRPLHIYGFNVEPALHRDLGELLLEPYTGRISGTVILEGRLQHGGVEVRLEGTDFVTFSDAGGSFTLVVPPGSYTEGLSAAREGFALDQPYENTIIVTRDGGFAVGELFLRATHNALQGRIRLDGQDDHTGIEVTVTGEAGGEAEGESATMVTPEDGRYRFDLLPMGRYRLTALYPLQPGWETVAIGGLQVRPGDPTAVPERALRERFVFINDHEEATTSADVTLTLGATDCHEMLVGNLPDLSDGEWQECAETLEWTLSDGDGIKVVYARFTTNAFPDTPTDVVSDDILLDGTVEIASFTHDADGPVGLGDDVHLRLDADEAEGRASVSIAGYARDILLYDDGTHGDVEAGDGVYELDYRILLVGDVNDAAVTGRFVDRWGNLAMRDTPEPLTVAIPPMVEEVRVETNSEAGTATISWGTDEPTTGELRWGSDDGYGNTEVLGETASSHSISFGAGVLEHGEEYHFAIVAQDAAGNRTQTRDGVFSLVPSGPGHAAALAGIDRVHVRWEAPFQGRLVGYHVYRAEVSGGPYERLTDEPYDHEALMYADETASNGTTWYYVITALDDAGNEGAESAEVSATPGPWEGPTEVWGVLVGTTTWTERGSPYTVTRDVALEPGSMLVIGPNTEVLVDGDRYFRVEGRLVLLGERGELVDDGRGNLVETDDGMAVIRSAAEDPTTSAWRGFDLFSTSPGGQLDLHEGRYLSGHFAYRARIRDVRRSFETMGGSGFAVALVRTVVEHSSSEYVRVDRSQLLVRSCRMTGAPGAESLVSAGNSRVLVTDSVFIGGAHGIRGGSNNAQFDVIRCQVRGSAHTGIYGARRVFDSEVTHHGTWGVDTSGDLIMADTLVAKNGEGVRADSAHYEIADCVLADNRAEGYHGGGGEGWLVSSELRGNLGLDRRSNYWPRDAFVSSRLSVLWGNFLRSPVHGEEIAAFVRGSLRYNHLTGDASSAALLVGTTDGWGPAVIRDNSVLGDLSGSDLLLRTPSDHRQPELDAGANYWGPAGTEELGEEAVHPRNVSFLWDYYDDINLAHIGYDGWRPSALPMARIDGPRYGSRHPAGAELTFTATAFDPEDGPLGPAQLEWRSDAGDLLDTGDTYVVSDLPEGANYLHVYAYDSDGQYGDIFTRVDIVAGEFEGCPGGCGPPCGDGRCEAERWEDWQRCPADCDVPPVPANNTCAGAESFEVDVDATVTIEGTTSGASHDFAGHPTESPDVFYTFHLDEPTSVELGLVSTRGWDTTLYLLGGSCDAPEVLATGDDDGGRLDEARLAVTDLAPGDYTVVATGYATRHHGTFTLTAREWNDLCEDAEHVPVDAPEPVVLRGTTVGAGHQATPHRSESPDVFYGFTLERPAEVEVLMQSEPSWDTYLLLLSGGCDGMERVHYNDDHGSWGSRLHLPSIGRGSWLVAATGHSPDDQGAFTLSFDFVEQSGADLCVDAEELQPTLEEPAVTYGSNAGAGHEYGPHRSQAPDVFYRFHLAEPTTVEAVVVTEPGWDTYLYLLRGPCDDLEEVERNDDWGNSHQSRIRQEELAAGDYLLMVTGYGDGTVGPFTLTVTLEAP